MPEPELSQDAPAEPPSIATNATKTAAPDYFAAALDDAERLLKYAAENVIDVDDFTRNSILEARATISDGWSEKTAANLLAALTKLAAQLKPVTAESLLNFNTKPTVRTYWIVSICLAACIVPFSVASFVSSAISQTIKADVATAHELAVKLNTQLGSSVTQVPAEAATAAFGAGGPTPSVASGVSPVDVVTELQTLASTIRAMHEPVSRIGSYLISSERWMNTQ